MTAWRTRYRQRLGTQIWRSLRAGAPMIIARGPLGRIVAAPGHWRLWTKRESLGVILKSSVNRRLARCRQTLGRHEALGSQRSRPQYSGHTSAVKYCSGYSQSRLPRPFRDLIRSTGLVAFWKAVEYGCFLGFRAQIARPKPSSHAVPGSGALTAGVLTKESVTSWVRSVPPSASTVALSSGRSTPKLGP